MVKLSKKMKYISIGDYAFLRPINFIENPIYNQNSVKLVNSIKNITIFGSVYGRDGDYCKESYELISNNVKKDFNSKLISKKVSKKNQLKIYNLFIKNSGHHESIYLVYKHNKTFRFSFIINKTDDDTFKIFDAIVNSLKKV